ncbi:MAG: hypothetical protein LUG46_03470 [Erysipelotrichaceae bacterium]|nr:hypothetical protein [Erysipelotrichaceae bacterium]
MIAIVFLAAFATEKDTFEVTNNDDGNSSNYFLTNAEVINSQNSHLIGKEVYDDTTLTAFSPNYLPNGDENINGFPINSVIKSTKDDSITLPTDFSVFEIKENATPEIIMPNGSAAIFIPENSTGCSCERGDTLILDFEKYKSEVVDAQTMVIGYAAYGVMYQGKTYKELSGRYELNIEEEGVYSVYIISATSDYLSLKSGSISIKRNE